MKENSQYLILFSSGNNNNKFYYAELLDDNETVLVKYGRVGSDGTAHKYPGGMCKYNSLLNTKRRKGYRDAMIDDSVGEDGVKVTENVIDTALKEIKFKDDMAKELVKAISEKNVHKITGSTSITFDAKDGLFKTPLGVIKRHAVQDAMELLKKIEDLLPIYLELKDPKSASAKGAKRDADGDAVKSRAKPAKTLATIKQEMLDLNDEYFSLVPNKVKNARDISNLLFTQVQIEEQRVTCDALIETLDLIEDLKKKKKEEKKEEDPDKKSGAFNIEIETVKDRDLLDEVIDKFEDSKNSIHGYFNNNTRVAQVYKLKLEAQQAPFEERSKEIGNVKQLWHGTRTQNLLSVLSKGLLLPKLSPGIKQGAMYGSGLYFADQSTKSLNYCDGGMYIRNGQGKETVYMLLASVAMGNTFIPSGAISTGPPDGYHSYWAKSGQSGIINDEFIVFEGDQIRLDYLIEVERI